MKKCVEYIDYGFSLYVITHNVFQVFVPADLATNATTEIVQTIGIGIHDVGALPTLLYIRLYNCKFDDFPIVIERDANGVFDNPIDKYLIFEHTKQYPKNQ